MVYGQFGSVCSFRTTHQLPEDVTQLRIVLCSVLGGEEIGGEEIGGEEIGREEIGMEGIGGRGDEGG
jgi:hypothetical protein